MTLGRLRVRDDSADVAQKLVECTEDAWSRWSRELQRELAAIRKTNWNSRRQGQREE